ncbi:MAG: sigma-70 family RNA polymerase sigma factor [Planctomycetes bacterium]|nr:sigma-70 family RNA polymerase sigma factor [Planctomycetota bacterium]
MVRLSTYDERSGGIQPGDGLGAYLQEVGSHELLSPSEEHLLLGNLIMARHKWTESFLGTEAGLTAVWEDLEKWKREEISARSIIPGPPKAKPGGKDVEALAERLYNLFARRVNRMKRPFAGGRKGGVCPLLKALLWVGLRPAPLDRYKAAAIKKGGPKLSKKIEQLRANFIAERRPLIERNLRLVLSVARKFEGGPMAYVELIQEGNLGLIRSTESFSARFSVRFSTYAYLWIRQAILRALEEKSRTIRLPVNVTQNLRKAQKEAMMEDNENGPGEARMKLNEMLANPTVNRPVLSLESGPDDETRLGDLVGDSNAVSPDQEVIQDDIRQLIRTSLVTLPERHQKILRMRFGIGADRPCTLGEIGKEIGVSAERVRQLEAAAFERLRAGPDAIRLAELLETN